MDATAGMGGRGAGARRPEKNTAGYAAGFRPKGYPAEENRFRLSM